MRILTDEYPGYSNRVEIEKFDHIGEFCDTMSETPEKYCSSMNDFGFSGVHSREECLNLLDRGDQATLGEVKDILSDISGVLTPMTRTRKKTRGPFGNLSVPAYLAGHPEPCRRRTKLLSTEGKIRIFLDLSASWVVTKEELRKYRLVVAGFAYALSKIRPVELLAHSIARTADERKSGGSDMICGQVIPLPLKPLDAIAASILAHPGVFRGAMLSRKHYQGDNTYCGIPMHDSSVGKARYLGGKRGDIIIPQLKGGAYRKLFPSGDEKPEAVAEKLMNDYLSGKGMAWEVIKPHGE